MAELEDIDRKIAEGKDITSDELNAYCEALLSGEFVLNNDDKFLANLVTKLEGQISDEALDSSTLRDNTRDDLVKVSQVQRRGRIIHGNLSRQQNRARDAEEKLLSAVANKDALIIAASFDIHKENLSNIDTQGVKTTLLRELANTGYLNIIERRRLQNRIKALVPNTRLDKQIADNADRQTAESERHSSVITTLESRRDQLRAQTQEAKQQDLQLRLDIIQKQMSGELTSAIPVDLEKLREEENKLQIALLNTPSHEDLKRQDTEADKNLHGLQRIYNTYTRAQEQIRKSDAAEQELETLSRIYHGEITSEEQISPEEFDRRTKELENEISLKAAAETRLASAQERAGQNYDGIDLSDAAAVQARIDELNNNYESIHQQFEESSNIENELSGIEDQIRLENQKHENSQKQLKTEASELGKQKENDPYGIEAFKQKMNRDGVETGFFKRKQSSELDAIISEAPTSQLTGLDKYLEEKAAALRTQAASTRSTKEIKSIEERIEKLKKYRDRISKEKGKRDKEYTDRTQKISKNQDGKINEAFATFQTMSSRMEKRDEILAQTTTLYKTLELVSQKMPPEKGRELMDRFRKQVKEHGMDLSGLTPAQQLSVVSALESCGHSISDIEARLGISKKTLLESVSRETENTDTTPDQDPNKKKEDERKNEEVRSNAVVTHVKRENGEEITTYESGLEVSRPDENTYNISGKDGKNPTDEQCAEFVNQLKQDKYESFSIDENVTPEFYASMVRAAEAAGLTIENKEKMDKKIQEMSREGMGGDSRTDGDGTRTGNGERTNNGDKEEKGSKLERNDKGEVMLTKAQRLALDAEGRLDVGGLNQKEGLTFADLPSQDRAYLEDLGLGQQHIKDALKKEARENNNLTEAQVQALDAEGRNVMGGEKKTFETLSSQDRAYLEEEGLGKDYKRKVERNTEFMIDSNISAKDITVEKMDLLAQVQDMSPEEFKKFQAENPEYKKLPASQRKLVDAVNGLKNNQEFKSKDEKKQAMMLGRIVGKYKESVRKEGAKDKTTKQRIIDHNITRHLATQGRSNG